MPAADERSWPIRKLIDRLRAAAFRVGPNEYLQALVVLTQEDAWPREHLRNVLAALLVTSASDCLTFDRLFDLSFPPVDGEDLIDPLVEPPPEPAPPEPPLEFVPPREDDPPPPPELRDKEKLEAPLEALRPPGIWGIVKKISAELLGDWLGAIILVLVAGGITALIDSLSIGDTGIKPPPGPPGHREAPWRAWILAGLLAAGLLGAILLVLRWLTRDRPLIERTQPPPPEHPEVVFRPGLVGGSPPPRVEQQRLAAIAEVFGYSDGEDDERELDAEGTIAEIIASSGLPMIRHPRSRVLPLVVVLTDSTSPGRYWNSTPDEIVQALFERGLNVWNSPFEGSLHAPARMGEGTGSTHLTSLGHDLRRWIEDEPYAVIMVFSDGNRWQAADTELLAGLASQGPLLWFDDRDRELWDSRLDSLRLARIPIYEATGAAVEEALRVAYAPGKGIGTRATTAGDALARRRRPTLEDEVRSLLGNAVGWARHCALLEPISVALAESIRQRFHSSLPWMTFSRLCALPGSIIGPEGLRFDARVRSQLFAGFAQLEPERLRDAVVEHIVEAVSAAGNGLPEDSPAHALWRLSLQRVEVHRRPDEAIREIVAIRETRLTEDEPLERFLRNLRPLGEEAGEHGRAALADPPILLGKPLRHAETIEALLSVQPGAPSRKKLPAWQISTPELRLDASRFRLDDGPVAAFARENELLVNELAPDAQQGDLLVSIAIPSGVRSETIAVEGRLARLETEDGIVAVSTADGRVFALFPEPPQDGAGGRGGYRRVPLEYIEGQPELIFVDARFQRAVAVARNTLAMIAQGEPRRPITASMQGRVTAACGFGDRFLVGNEYGQLLLIGEQGDTQRVAGLVLPGPVVGLAPQLPVGTEATVPSLLAIGYSEAGTERYYIAICGVEPPAGSPPAVTLSRRCGVPVPGRPRLLELSHDGVTLLVVTGKSIDIVDAGTGTSQLTSDASFLLESLGAIDLKNPRVVAASLANRRIAVLTADPARLEIRRLERHDLDETDVAEPTTQAESEPKAAAPTEGPTAERAPA